MSIKTIKQSVNLLDLKIRVPPHLAQRLSTTSEIVHLKTEPDVLISDETPKLYENKGVLYEHLLSKRNLVNALCMLTLSPFILDTFPLTVYTQQMKGCVFLFLSPITFSCLFFFNLQHKNSKSATFLMAFFSLLLGNLSCILYCASTTITLQGFDVALLALSFSLILGTFQLLMLINKKNIAVVMISTATMVVVCGLSIAGLFLQNTASKRCYQSTIPCILWLFWQSTLNHTYFSNHLQISSSERVEIKNVT